MNNEIPTKVLWTKDYLLAFASNLLLFFSFYMLIPVLPFYLIENLGTSNSVAGIVLSLYTISALIIRPFSGFMVDMFARKPLYLICYGAFCIIFAGYAVGTTLIIFIILRILHGFAFGISTVSGSTIAIDIMVPERRGEGIGYFGMAANIAMAIGPVAGLWIYKEHSVTILFCAAFVASFIGWLAITQIKPIKKEQPVDATEPIITLDRFILVRALPCILLLFLGGLGYGTVINYISVYSKQAAFESNAGLFFILIAIGIIMARLLSAKPINKGKIVSMIYIGCIPIIIAFALFIICNSAIELYLIAFLLGIGFGYLTPAFQTMLINLADHNQRGTANATYFTFWDLGIGLGVALGGFILEKFNFQWLYGISGACIVVGLIYFRVVSASYFEKKKLR